MKLQTYLPFFAAFSIAVFMGCEKSPLGPSVSSVSSTPGFDGKIDGEDFFYQEGTEFESGAAADKTVGQSGSGSSAVFESWVCKLTVPNEGLQITKGQLAYSGDKPEEENFKHFVIFADNSYAPAGSREGIIVTYIDADGTKWSSNMGSANQDGSELNIISTKEETFFDDLYIKAYIKFNCKIYNANGDVKTISNARFVGRFNR